MRGHLSAAADDLEEALATEQVFGTLAGAAPFFGNFAVLAIAAGQPEVAARLLATAAGVLARRGMAFDLPERREYERARGEAQRHLGDAAFQASWNLGWERMIEEAASDVATVLAVARSAINTVPRAPLPVTAGLTPREREVLHLVAQGHSNREIADALCISVPTVKRHLTNILGKLDLRSRSALNTFAHAHGLV
jgi:DNA-binding CsgD family transcriptional regulator